MSEIKSIFENIGGQFCTPFNQLSERLAGVKAFIYDWDGVFNNAVKNENKSSNFNEADSMGTNMLRFSHYLKKQELPKTAIISGEKNEFAFYFSEREHFDACYYKVPNKIIALDHFCALHQINREEVCYTFDDVLDLSIAAVCGVRMMINRKANPLFKNYIIKNKLADYITAAESGNFAVRECSELLMGLNQNYDACLDERKDFTPIYRSYIEARQTLPTAFFTIENERVIASVRP
jgi:3-deoxy-D-manno-octulosonate 8-phosphate phosphatase (KDO 8-P phosphatase)